MNQSNLSGHKTEIKRIYDVNITPSVSSKHLMYSQFI